MLKIQKASIDSCKRWTKAKYTLWENNKICIVKHYSSCSPRYWRDIEECFDMIIYGCLSIIGFPLVLIYTLYSFIPAIYIKDSSIDEKKQEQRNKANAEMEMILKKEDDINNE
ncbi:hypothetical protein ACFHWD_04315 [Clostridium sp. MT-14]|uniref:hypothetical protein n=1 Tax=Clostridium sp. MT-14 TaxID=3348360 RepID=UPI0035F337D8